MGGNTVKTRSKIACVAGAWKRKNGCMRGTHARVEQAPVAPTASKRLLRTLGLRRTAMRPSDHGRSNFQSGFIGSFYSP